MGPATCVWIDDTHPIFRGGLAACLRTGGFRVVGESAELSPEPSLAGLDILLFEATSRMLSQVVRLTSDLDLALVAVVDTSRRDVAADAVEAGIPAVLPRESLTPGTLAAALRAVMEGSTSLPPGLLEQLLDRAARAGRQKASNLSNRELDVLRLLAEGEDTRQIAGQLKYSERTVKNVVHDLLVKMNCRNRAHAVALGARQGMI
jgi:DNA-binding NarL/FixJ family response regulator